MTQIIMPVGPGLALPNGIAWSQATSARDLDGVFTQVSPGTHKAPGEYINDAFHVHQRMINTIIDGAGAEGTKARIINRLPSSVPNVPGETDSGSMGDKGIIVVRGDNTTLRNLILEGARASKFNGAGVRLDGGTNLTMEGLEIWNCENGFLGSPQDDPLTPVDERGIVTIKRSLFAHCGFGGQAHPMYCGKVLVFNLIESTVTNAIGQGNSVKTRGDVNNILNTSVTSGAGYNSRLYDAMGGENNIQWCAFQLLVGSSSQPKAPIHIYFEPQSKPGKINIQYNVFDFRGQVAGKPILIDPRILRNGDGGIGADGLHHAPGDNYYVQGEYATCEGLVDNNVFLVNKDPKNHFGWDAAAGHNRVIWTPNDASYGPIPLPPGLIEGPNNRFIVVG